MLTSLGTYARNYFVLVGLQLTFVYPNLAQVHTIIDGELIGMTKSADPAEVCTFTLVESVPENLTYSPTDPRLMSTYAAHKRLLERAKKSIHLSTFYWSLLGSDTPVSDYSASQGADIFQTLLAVVKAGVVDVKIVQNSTYNDTEKLASAGAQVRTIDFQRLLKSGVMHTKMWIVDDMHAYLGSCNFDWRSYSQIKETGVLIENCPSLVSDAAKIFEVYWYLSDDSRPQIPSQWPANYSTDINATSPQTVYYNQSKGLVYLSSSPPPFCPDGRTKDLDAIVNVIRAANKFIYIAVMDYLPLTIYTRPEKFWPFIDDELRRAAFERHVSVYLMASRWDHTKYEMYPFLRSLNSLKGQMDVQVKLFTVPSTPEEKRIPYARVSHSKYMVTDQHAYIGTSNWSGDYFISTAGVGFVLQEPDDGLQNSNTLREQLTAVFLRDWHSNYTEYVRSN
ncbi:unnamed protein product [Lymnaea stagnalis]|uniref:PLD phosphodiesterase domain-containing protein n=1 Tax=Lymnaea stagnalis TaxID=6523 RepID=A0AAV2HV58_LYMST